jgi:hypothetical protein
MSDENKIRDAADAIKGIVEAVPVYQDAAQPAVKELGAALQTVAKTVRIALAPLDALVWGYDRIKDYLHETLTEKLKRVPEERIIAPNPTIAGPTVESLRFVAHEPTLRELYANLLATSMDASTAHNAHPAFVEIIRQLSPDEARIMECLASATALPMITVGRGFMSFGKYDSPIYDERLKYFSSLNQLCAFTDLILVYLTNLARLGLVEVKENYPLAGENLYSPLENDPQVKELIIELEKRSLSEAQFSPYRSMDPLTRKDALLLTPLGSQFCRVCLSNTHHEV